MTRMEKDWNLKNLANLLWSFRRDVFQKSQKLLMRLAFPLQDSFDMLFLVNPFPSKGFPMDE